MVVLVTGCRSGFGLLIAVEAAKAGHTVYAGLRDLSTRADLDAAAAGLSVLPVQLDVTRREEREAVVAMILEAHGHIDALVNNAGAALGGFLEQVEEDELRRLMELNFFSVWSLTRLVLPSMRQRGSGRIVNISSMSGIMALPALGAYASTKFALEGMSEAWRHELAPFGIKVVLLEPGPYRTDIFTRNKQVTRAAGESPESTYAVGLEKLQAKVGEVNEARGGDPVEVARYCVGVLEHPNPALRHPLGKGSSTRAMLKRLLPFRLVEWVVRRVLGSAYGPRSGD